MGEKDLSMRRSAMEMPPLNAKNIYALHHKTLIAIALTIKELQT
jgi:hypothetical protein